MAKREHAPQDVKSGGCLLLMRLPLLFLSPLTVHRILIILCAHKYDQYSPLTDHKPTFLGKFDILTERDITPIISKGRFDHRVLLTAY